MRKNLIGDQGRLFAELQPSPDEKTFSIDNTSDTYYNSPYFTIHKEQLQAVPAPRSTPPRMTLETILGKDVTSAIQKSKKIQFHAVGDTGAAKVKTGPATEASVADMMAKDVQTALPDAPAFFLHLGDVIYNFGEGQYYYDQFYEPFRAYDRPIFAIPGNHDGMVFGDKTDVPKVATLKAFLRNFCAPEPARSPDAPAMLRSVMTQPGVYFTLDAPLVSVIGLYSNVLDTFGVISSQGKHYPIGDEQLQFLQSELTRLKPARERLERAVILAVHHPPISADSKHGGSTGLSKDIDAACQKAGFWPDAILSGHAHLYQRFTRRLSDREIPYVVSGSGGFAKTRPREGIPPAGTLVGDHTLEITPVIEFGYLTVTIDMSGAVPTLTIAFSSPNPQLGTSYDSVTINLKEKTLFKKPPSPKK